MKTTVKKHKPTGALVWFPNDSNLGIVVKDGYPWKSGQSFAHWNSSDLEQVNQKVTVCLENDN